MNRYPMKLSTTLILLMFFSVTSIYAEEIDYAELAIIDLLQIRIVTSVGKKEQSIADAPAAVYVVTSRDIRNSGVTTIPDALRMVPGLYVAKTSSHSWAVSVRGFTGAFVNKLLVLVDGRSVYTPEFSGVWWDTVDTVLDDIDRIEVIRGPGSTLWGANAVNGVINIITKNSKETKGGLVSVAVGDENKNVTNLRYGGMLDESTETSFRVYSKILKRDNYTNTPSDDKWYSTQAGFRVDGKPFSQKNDWMLQVNTYRVKEDEIHWFTNQSGDGNAKGFHLLSSLDHQFSEDSTLTTQIYYDEYQRKIPSLDVFNKIFDLDIQHRFALNAKHELMWGVGYRWLSNEIPQTDFFLFSPAKRIDSLFSAFIQDEISLTDKHTLTIGTKLEHNDYSGWEIQPNFRYLWTPTEQLSLWGAISRAVRTPSRREHDMLLQVPLSDAINPFYPTPFVSRTESNPEFESEVLLAYELGLRQQLTDNVTWDLSLFFNDYSKLFANARNIIPAPNNQQVFSLDTLDNFGTAEAFGLELAADYRTSDSFNVHLAYSYFGIKPHFGEEVMKVFKDVKEAFPKHQISLRMTNNLLDNVHLTTWLYHASALNPVLRANVASYTTLDIRLAWDITDNLELSLVGQNLLDKQHVEFYTSSVNPLYGEVERSVYGQIRWEF